MLTCLFIKAESWTQDPDGVPTQPLNGGQPPVLRYELSETRIREIQEHLSRKGAQPTDGDSNHVGSVQCQCGWNGEEAQMVRRYLMARNPYEQENIY